MTDPLYKVGDRVRAARNSALTMMVAETDRGRSLTVRDGLATEQSNAIVDASPIFNFYRCQPDNGTTSKWFREDDLVRM